MQHSSNQLRRTAGRKRCSKSGGCQAKFLPRRELQELEGVACNRMREKRSRCLALAVVPGSDPRGGSHNRLSDYTGSGRRAPTGPEPPASATGTLHSLSNQPNPYTYMHRERWRHPERMSAPTHASANVRAAAGGRRDSYRRDTRSYRPPFFITRLGSSRPPAP